tara:strand:- start:3086 stop:3562 length:477 start_codon:yes stop_codon:yes gene_type:complete
MVMINIDFVGRWPEQDRFEEYTHNVLNHFFKYRLKRNVDINLKMINNLKVLGWSDGDRNEVNIELCRKDSNSDKIPVTELAKTLAHELVHAKQFLRGEINGKNDYYTRGKSKCINYSKTSYREQPWEHEAFMMEDFLHKLYWESNRYIKLTQKIFQYA